MTLKGHKSHYNIKLLRGYGVSINLKENKLILKNGQNDITGESQKLSSFSNFSSKCSKIFIINL